MKDGEMYRNEWESKAIGLNIHKHTKCFNVRILQVLMPVGTPGYFGGNSKLESYEKYVTDINPITYSVMN